MRKPDKAKKIDGAKKDPVAITRSAPEVSEKW